MSKRRELFVAAIDFGTTYSGYAYSSREDYNSDPLKVHCPNWSDGGTMVTYKAPTVILFDKTKKFHSFGFDAESKYADLANKDKHVGWRYFRRFKMELFRKRVRLSNKLEDEQGQLMPALDVFSAAIGYLKDDLMTRLHEKVNDSIRAKDIHWVLTVPAIWEDAAKQFMAAAAEKAGIPEQQLTLAYEPEAAAVFCKESKISKNKKAGQKAGLLSLGAGSKFMIVDLGGGTVDISAHEVRKGGTLAALAPPSGGAWGGTIVDKKLNKFLEELLGRDVLDEFSVECKDDKLDMERMLELKKRTLKRSMGEDDDEVHMKLPAQLFEVYKVKHPDKTFHTSVQMGKFKETVRQKRDRLHITKQLLINMFDESRDSVIQHLHMLLGQRELRDIKIIMLVGGFSESEIIQTAIKDAFPLHDVIAPEDGGTAIIKGAVMFGHNPDAICSRKMAFSYGISTAVPFDHRIHPPHLKGLNSSGFAKCEDVFKIFVRKGETVLSNETTYQHTFRSQSKSSATIEVYKSSTDPPPLSVRDCTKVAEFTLNLRNYEFSEKPLIEVAMKFGDTKIRVTAKEHDTNNDVGISVNWLC